MILSKIADYLAGRQRVALIDLAHHLGSDPEAVRPMLATLERKGRVRKLPVGTPCTGGCSQCEPTSIEIYEWVDASVTVHS